jgi:hypothetical protein
MPPIVKRKIFDAGVGDDSADRSFQPIVRQ